MENGKAQNSRRAFSVCRVGVVSHATLESNGHLLLRHGHRVLSMSKIRVVKSEGLLSHKMMMSTKNAKKKGSGPRFERGASRKHAWVGTLSENHTTL